MRCSMPEIIMLEIMPSVAGAGTIVITYPDRAA